jgi:hypothetical protein
MSIPRALKRAFKWFASFAVASVAGAFIVGWVFSRMSAPQMIDWATWHVQHGSSGWPTSCGSTSWLQESTPTNAEAFNELAPEGPNTYYAANTIDGRNTTAWAQRFPAANGHATINWTLDNPRRLRLACISLGYTKNYSSFEQNERLESGTITFPDTQCRPVNIYFPDRLSDIQAAGTGDFADLAAIPLDCRSREVELTINSTYPATDHSSDFAISEFKLYASP